MCSAAGASAGPNISISKDHGTLEMGIQNPVILDREVPLRTSFHP